VISIPPEKCDGTSFYDKIEWLSGLIIEIVQLKEVICPGTLPEKLSPDKENWRVYILSMR
jgi:hypothetical protein